MFILGSIWNWKTNADKKSLIIAKGDTAFIEYFKNCLVVLVNDTHTHTYTCMFGLEDIHKNVHTYQSALNISNKEQRKKKFVILQIPIQPLIFYQIFEMLAPMKGVC